PNQVSYSKVRWDPRLATPKNPHLPKVGRYGAPKHGAERGARRSTFMPVSLQIVASGRQGLPPLRIVPLRRPRDVHGAPDMLATAPPLWRHVQHSTTL